MKKDFAKEINLDRHLGCFGAFDVQDPVCRKHCAINLRCVIEKNQNLKMEILEDLVSTDSLFFKIQ